MGLSALAAEPCRGSDFSFSEGRAQGSLTQFLTLETSPKGWHHAILRQSEMADFAGSSLASRNLEERARYCKSLDAGRRQRYQGLYRCRKKLYEIPAMAAQSPAKLAVGTALLGCISSFVEAYLTRERPARLFSKAKASGWETGSNVCSERTRSIIGASPLRGRLITDQGREGPGGSPGLFGWGTSNRRFNSPVG
jgi:hypothetical protein